MFPEKNQQTPIPQPKTYPLGEIGEHLEEKTAMALVVLSHSAVEQRLYAAMLQASSENGEPPEPLTARRLLALTGIRSLSTIRRGLDGLLAKLSIKRQTKDVNNGREAGAIYCVYQPEEVIARRRAQGFRGVETRVLNYPFERAIKRIVEHQNLSRREAQVALCCVEGLTNAEIGSRLQVTEQTVKFHLRHVFVKLGVKRRTELISKLLR